MTRIKPPRLAQSLLLLFLRNDLGEEVQGDLDEKFYASLKKKTIFKAKLNYWYEVFNYVRPFALKLSTSHSSNHYTMLQNYFKIGWRNLTRQKMYSSIKIGGFAIGIAACFLISLFIRDELSYDRQYTNGSRIYRIVGAVHGEEIHRDVFMSAPLAKVLKEDYPEVEKSGRYLASELFGAGSNQIRRAEQTENTYEEGFAYFDQELLEIFNLPMVYGTREHALREPNTIVITKRKADKYFPNEDPVGKTFIINDDDKTLYKVGGVIEDFLPSSHFKFDFFITLSGREFGKGEQTNWRQSNYPTYILLAPGTNAPVLAEKMTKGVLEKYILPVMLAAGEVNAREDLKKAHVELQPLQDIYLSTEVQDGLPHSDIRYIWLFGAIAAFILIIACINFINLSTAKSANRAKEVGLRKVVGSFRSSIVNQFLTESVLFSLLSFTMGVLLAWLLLPYFNLLSSKMLIFPWKEWWLFPLVATAAMLIGLLAGLYPAVYLSSFKPIQVLKGNVSKGSKNSGTRSLLVIFQFTTSIILIVGTFVIYRQMEYILNKKIGFDKDQVLLIQGTNTLGDKIISFKNELVRVAQVKHATIGDYLPVKGTKRNGNPFWKEGKMREDKAVGGQMWIVDNDYIKTMGMKVTMGRDFGDRLSSDSAGVIINQAMVKQLNLVDPVGKVITNGMSWTVLGVVEDFHFESMKENIGPLAMRLGISPSIVSVKASASDISGLIRAIEKVWKEFSPGQPIRIAFLDERYARMYEDVQRTGRIFSSFAVLAIIVACLGLFALSAFMVEQRNKEISIRLVLGASGSSIFRLLTQNFVKLVLISFVIASPIAWYLMQKWLEDYVYKTGITWDVFALAGVMALIIAISTISYQSIRAALIRPVENLKME